MMPSPHCSLGAKQSPWENFKRGNNVSRPPDAITGTWLSTRAEWGRVGRSEVARLEIVSLTWVPPEILLQKCSVGALVTRSDVVWLRAGNCPPRLLLFPSHACLICDFCQCSSSNPSALVPSTPSPLLSLLNNPPKWAQGLKCRSGFSSFSMINFQAITAGDKTM